MAATDTLPIKLFAPLSIRIVSIAHTKNLDQVEVGF